MRRVVSNIEILDDDDRLFEPGPDLEVAANVVLYQLAVQASRELRIWPGTCAIACVEVMMD
ncbi:MAG: hypothetical protein ACI8Y4_003265 [Candidatus Poriferisodalaceae bacterium]|jgi:hypothetical protein